MTCECAALDHQRTALLASGQPAAGEQGLDQQAGMGGHVHRGKRSAFSDQPLEHAGREVTIDKFGQAVEAGVQRRD